MQCTLREPMSGFLKTLHKLEAYPGMLTATVAMGFPFADIDCMGVTVLAVADGEQAVAETVAEELARQLWNLKEQLQPELVMIEDAIQKSRETDGLVIFADGSDNPGGGAPCDGTVALAALIKAGLA